MKFLVPDDINSSINPKIIDELTSGNHDILDKAEELAIADAYFALLDSYECDMLFAQKGIDRHPILVQAIVDFTIYHLFWFVNPDLIPNLRKDRNDQAFSWLSGVAKGTLNSTLPFRNIELDFDAIGI